MQFPFITVKCEKLLSLVANSSHEFTIYNLTVEGVFWWQLSVLLGDLLLSTLYPGNEQGLGDQGPRALW